MQDLYFVMGSAPAPGASGFEVVLDEDEKSGPSNPISMVGKESETMVPLVAAALGRNLQGIFLRDRP